ncbi:hypothetical protein HPG69_012986 [Diceros bicornis minor]|uniref:Uncharacterized protein n=1 Tax=Diceros bicornis minor TaxID=77932 RepID=A0A7J7F1C8_DICBM|nr:hypothetical protein HPG69_012986 [Diceros bicornis minor]
MSQICHMADCSILQKFKHLKYQQTSTLKQQVKHNVSETSLSSGKEGKEKLRFGGEHQGNAIRKMKGVYLNNPQLKEHLAWVTDEHKQGKMQKHCEESPRELKPS